MYELFMAPGSIPGCTRPHYSTRWEWCIYVDGFCDACRNLADNATRHVVHRLFLGVSCRQGGICDRVCPPDGDSVPPMVVWYADTRCCLGALWTAGRSEVLQGRSTLCRAGETRGGRHPPGGRRVARLRHLSQELRLAMQVLISLPLVGARRAGGLPCRYRFHAHLARAAARHTMGSQCSYDFSRELRPATQMVFSRHLVVARRADIGFTLSRECGDSPCRYGRASRGARRADTLFTSSRKSGGSPCRYGSRRPVLTCLTLVSRKLLSMRSLDAQSRGDDNALSPARALLSPPNVIVWENGGCWAPCLHYPRF